MGISDVGKAVYCSKKKLQKGVQYIRSHVKALINECGNEYLMKRTQHGAVKHPDLTKSCSLSVCPYCTLLLPLPPILPLVPLLPLLCPFCLWLHILHTRLDAGIRV